MKRSVLLRTFFVTGLLLGASICGASEPVAADGSVELNSSVALEPVLEPALEQPSASSSTGSAGGDATEIVSEVAEPPLVTPTGSQDKTAESAEKLESGVASLTSVKKPAAGSGLSRTDLIASGTMGGLFLLQSGAPSAGFWRTGLGVGIEHRTANGWGIGADFTRQATLTPDAYDILMTGLVTGHLGYEMRPLGPGQRLSPFAYAGMGAVWFSGGEFADADLFFKLGGGLRIRLTDAAAFRLDVRLMPSSLEAGSEGYIDGYLDARAGMSLSF